MTAALSILIFLFLLLAQQFFSIPLVALFLFWEITSEDKPSITEQFINAIVWGCLSGVSLGLIGANMVYWSLAMSASACLVVFLKNYLLVARTLPTLTLLLLIMIASWRIFAVNWTVNEFILMMAVQSFLFCFFHALTQSKKNHTSVNF